MNKNFRAHGIIILSFVCIFVLSCCSKKSVIFVPIRESEFRAEHFLPLDDSEMRSIVEFIADGGIQRDDGFQAGVEHENFQRFLMFFKDEANLTYGAFVVLPGLKEFVDPEKPVLDVIDAREEKGAYQNNRLAYRYRDFWFVFMVDKLYDEDGRPIRDRDKKFSRIIVMKVLDRTEKAK